MIEERFEVFIKVSGRFVLLTLAEVGKAAEVVITAFPIVLILVAGIPLGAQGLDELRVLKGHDVNGDGEVEENVEDDISCLVA